MRRFIASAILGLATLGAWLVTPDNAQANWYRGYYPYSYGRYYSGYPYTSNYGYPSSYSYGYPGAYTSTYSPSYYPRYYYNPGSVSTTYYPPSPYYPYGGYNTWYQGGYYPRYYLR